LCWQRYFRFLCVDSFASAVVESSRQCPAGSRQPRRRLGAGAGHVHSDSWTAPILTALKCTHALLIAEYECAEWGPAAGPASSDALVAIAGHAGTQNPIADGTGHSTTVAGFTPTIYALRKYSGRRPTQQQFGGAAAGRWESYDSNYHLLS